MDDILESLRRSDEWLLDWEAEIEGVARCVEARRHPDGPAATECAHDVPRLGPELTAMAGRARELQHYYEENLRISGQDHPDTAALGNRAWGAREVLALGLGVRFGLGAAEARWLADALAGFRLENEWPALAARRDRRRVGEGTAPPPDTAG
ncbi:hypothetical protein [Amycolatopsis sp. NPDC004079]|uniref:hypothetical protein n=1 Tax=Amycolatopsis sp. NPDC004079 TaxID=3154549 RepID=UPI0033AB5A0C